MTPWDDPPDLSSLWMQQKMARDSRLRRTRSAERRRLSEEDRLFLARFVEFRNRHISKVPRVEDEGPSCAEDVEALVDQKATRNETSLRNIILGYGAAAV